MEIPIFLWFSYGFPMVLAPLTVADPFVSRPNPRRPPCHWTPSTPWTPWTPGARAPARLPAAVTHFTSKKRVISPGNHGK